VVPVMDHSYVYRGKAGELTIKKGLSYAVVLQLMNDLSQSRSSIVC